MLPAAKPVAVVGGGGHALVVIEALRTEGRSVLGVIDPQEPRRLPSNVRHLGIDLSALRAEEVDLALGVGSIDVGPKNRRPAIFDEGIKAGFRWATVRHASAIVAPDVQLGEGVQLMAGCVIQPGAKIGNNVIVNTRASIDHECVIGDHVHLAPGVTVSGGVAIGPGSHLGTGCIVIQGITIGAESFVGAGAVITAAIGDRERVVLPRHRP